jgi:hypothetical protein
MAWNVPRSWTDGEVVTDTIFNQELKDNFDQMGTHAHSGSAGDGASILGSLNTVVFSDGTADPTAAGTLIRNGSSLKWHNDTLVIVVAGTAGSGTPSQRSVGTGGLEAAGGTHVHTPTAVGTVAGALTNVGTSTAQAFGGITGLNTAGFQNMATGTITPGGTQRVVVASFSVVARGPGNPTATTAVFVLARDGTNLMTATIDATDTTNGSVWTTAYTYIDTFTAATARVYTVAGSRIGGPNVVNVHMAPVIALAQIRTLPP